MGVRDFREIAARLFRELDRRNISLVAAGVAFFLMLAVFPTLAALIAVLGLATDPAALRDGLELVRPFMPPNAFEIFAGQVEDLISAPRSTLNVTFVLSLAASGWSSRAGIAALMRGLNTAYLEPNRAGFLSRLGRGLILTIALITMGVVAIICVLLVPAALAVLPLGTWSEIVVQIGRWTVAIGALVLGIGIVYRYGPNRRNARVKWLSAGALAAVLLWSIGSVALNAYFASFDRYNEVYGSIGAVISLLLWFYISAFAVLFGSLLNAQIELQTHKDTTIGPDCSPGDRGAFVADHVALDGETVMATETRVDP